MQSQMERMLNNPAYGEDIVYLVNGYLEYPIKAFVKRHGITKNPARFDRGTENRIPKYDIEIDIMRTDDVTKGRLEINIKSDVVSLSKTLGGPATRMKVQEITYQDQACWRLGLAV